MSKSQSLEHLLARAKGKEKKYNWHAAAESYENALRLTTKSGDFSKAGEIQERIGYCLYRSAFQAETQEEFKPRMLEAVKAYEKAHGVHGKLADEQKASMFRCESFAKYIGYWLTRDPSEKRALLDQCLELEDKALAVFAKSGDMLKYGKTYNELPHVFWLRITLEWSRQTSKSIIEKGLRWGEKAVAALSKLNNSCELARAYFTLATCLSMFIERFIADPEEQERHQRKMFKYLNKAVDLSEKVGDAHFSGLSHCWIGTWDIEQKEAIRHFEKTLEHGKRTKDNFLIALGLDMLAYTTYWKACVAEDPEKRRELAEKAMQFYDEAQNYYSKISFVGPINDAIAWPVGYAEYYLLSSMFETDLEKRRGFQKKSEKIGMEGLELAKGSDMPWVISGVHDVLSKTFEAQARIESDPSEKRSRLKKALIYREKASEILEQLSPFDFWGRGASQCYLARIKGQLAGIEPNLASKRKLLEEAVVRVEEGLKLSSKDLPYFIRVGNMLPFAGFQRLQELYATLLMRLYDLTHNAEHLRKAVDLLQKAIESASKVDLISRIAELYWKIAKAQDTLEEHVEASKSFERASESYMKGAEKIPQLSDFYQDYATYMKAWSEIEKAKHNHAKKKYGLAKEHYEKAANLHKETKRWHYLSANYSALARVEEAEDLSRNEQTEEAKNLFQQAAKLFTEAKESVQAKLKKMEAKDEIEMAAGLSKASDIRRKYCLGRIALEEAKILDRRGDHAASSGKYGSASEKLQKAIDIMEYESDRKELRPIVILTRAWQMMTRAEAEASPDLYLEASKLFDQAKELSLDEKARVLALGHSSFCKALEAGTRFEATRDDKLHLAAIRHLGSASSYYVKAGFKTASEYAKATHRLFDAYIYTDKADTETDPTKKAQHCQMAEKLLQTSADLFKKAKHPEKGEEAQRLLESVKEERKLALSLAQVLHAPAITSTTTSFSTPTPTYEEAAGLEIFEHAHVQANFFVQNGDINVGEDIVLEIEMVNAGKGVATLVKVEDIVPARAFKVVEKPEVYRLEDSYLNMRGKRLDPLKGEDIKLVVKSLSKGMFRMKPRILYLDETGKYKSHEPEPVTITVKELGIKGWIKGKR